MAFCASFVFRVFARCVVRGDSVAVNINVGSQHQEGYPTDNSEDTAASNREQHLSAQPQFSERGAK
jgi:hypothetical protein